MKFMFSMPININVSYKLILTFWMLLVKPAILAFKSTDNPFFPLQCWLEVDGMLTTNKIL